MRAHAHAHAQSLTGFGRARGDALGDALLLWQARLRCGGFCRSPAAVVLPKPAVCCAHDLRPLQPRVPEGSLWSSWVVCGRWAQGAGRQGGVGRGRGGGGGGGLGREAGRPHRLEGLPLAGGRWGGDGSRRVGTAAGRRPPLPQGLSHRPQPPTSARCSPHTGGSPLPQGLPETGNLSSLNYCSHSQTGSHPSSARCCPPDRQALPSARFSSLQQVASFPQAGVPPQSTIPPCSQLVPPDRLPRPLSQVTPTWTGGPLSAGAHPTPTPPPGDQRPLSQADVSP